MLAYIYISVNKLIDLTDYFGLKFENIPINIDLTDIHPLVVTSHICTQGNDELKNRSKRLVLDERA
jgi:hypothetical protein